jgi:succinate dehydrogenase / fumarate reductase iron-sulfur subunit
VCPEDIHITDNAIIPLKERVVDDFYDPVLGLVRKIASAMNPAKQEPAKT